MDWLDEDDTDDPIAAKLAKIRAQQPAPVAAPPAPAAVDDPDPIAAKLALLRADPAAKAHADAARATSMSARASDTAETGADRARGAVDSALQGLTFGGSDEMIGAVRAILPEILGGTKGFDYTGARDEERAAQRAFSAAHPKTATALEIAGGILPTIATGGASALEGAGATGKVLNAALQGGKYGLATGIGTGEGDVGDQLKHAALQTGAGVLFGPALSLVGSAAGKLSDVTGLSELASRGATKVAGALPAWALKEAARIFGSSTGARGKAAQEIESRLGSEGTSAAAVSGDVAGKQIQNAPDFVTGMSTTPKPELLADYSPEVRSLTKAVTKQPGPGRAQINDVLNDRAASTATRVGQDVVDAAGDEMQPSAKSLYEELAMMRAKRAEANFPRAYAAGVAGIDDPAIQEILSRPTFAKLYKDAKTMAADEGVDLPVKSETSLEAPPSVQKLIDQAKPENRQSLIDKLTQAGAIQETTTETPIPDVKTIHYVDRALRRAIDSGFEGKGPIVDPGHAQALQGTFNDLRAQMVKKVPEFGTALDQYARDSQRMDALKTGLHLFDYVDGNAVPPGAMGEGVPLAVKDVRGGIDGVLAATKDMDLAQRRLFRHGAREAVLDRLASKEPTVQGSTQAVVSEIFGESPKAKQWQRLLFDSPQASDDFQNNLAREVEMRRTNAMMNGSDTAANLNERADLVGDLDIPTSIAGMRGKVTGAGAKQRAQDVYDALGERLSASGSDLPEMLRGVSDDVTARRKRAGALELARNLLTIGRGLP